VTLFSLVHRNLRRNRLRTGLTLLAVALPLIIFVLATTVVNIALRIAASAKEHLRLAVHHKVSLINPLPEAHRRRIEELDPEHTRIKAVCGMRWFGGRVPNDQFNFPSLAGDPDTWPIAYPEHRLTSEELAAWQSERRAAVVGTTTADRFGWKVGQKITLKSVIPPYLTVELKIVKITTAGDTRMVSFRRDYLDEMLRAVGAPAGYANIFWVKCHRAEDLGPLQRQIDELFRNSPDQTKTEDEEAFLASFLKMQGDLPNLMAAVAAFVVLVVILVAANTMSMSFRERVGEVAVFKALGFSRRAVLLLILAESVTIALWGGILGSLPLYLLLKLFPDIGFGPISRISVPPRVVGVALGMSVVIGLLAGLVPAARAYQLRVVDALRRVA